MAASSMTNTSWALRLNGWVMQSRERIPAATQSSTLFQRASRGVARAAASPFSSCHCSSLPSERVPHCQALCHEAGQRRGRGTGRRTISQIICNRMRRGSPSFTRPTWGKRARPLRRIHCHPWRSKGKMAQASSQKRVRPADPSLEPPPLRRKR
ncbi:hypothetical protein D3C84_389350 [compost metagenome]